VLHVLLAGLHQFRQFLMALAHQHVDVRPGLAHAVLEAHQPVIENDRISCDKKQHDQRDDGARAHQNYSRIRTGKAF